VVTGDIFNVAGEEVYSVMQTLELFEAAANRVIPASRAAKDFGHLDVSAGSADRLRSVTGWRRRRDLPSFIESLITGPLRIGEDLDRAVPIVRPADDYSYPAPGGSERTACPRPRLVLEAADRRGGYQLASGIRSSSQPTNRYPVHHSKPRAPRNKVITSVNQSMVLRS
jgi:hypothetical protein